MAKTREELISFFEDNYCVGAGSPGMSSVGNMGGNTNKGLRPLKNGEENKAKAYALKRMMKNK